jgi:hypothetical protein
LLKNKLLSLKNNGITTDFKCESEGLIIPIYRGVTLSQPFKLQKVALDQLGMLALNLELLEEDVHMILESCCAYLSEEQPQPLQVNLMLYVHGIFFLQHFFFQESCIELFKFMTRVNCDAVWLRLNALWNNSQELSASSSLCLNIRVRIKIFSVCLEFTNICSTDANASTRCCQIQDKCSASPWILLIYL